MQSERKEHPGDMDEALPDVMMRVVSELHDVAYLIERIEPMLGEIAGDPQANAAHRIQVLQGIDLAVQKTRGLAEFIDTITAALPESWLVDISTALNLVKLADMQKSLANGLRHGHSQPLTEAAGDFEAF
ncbi:hypothetical protein C8J35_102761 [Rhizobium sp. PP-F2F-G38]|uniref:Uncharacterized protein n=1 Tax=Ferranicluibacter rubi TaxID=2715133 RepID=A0AA44CAU7_9HYPH|nr:hypothetical protein [Ferranicluibacter rubi]PYE29188.1 hypothetical protein C8J32_1011052 [Rhizobium sp. PP-CC-3A-592]PYE36373.1 hypothetical protein C8J37_102761 [Rhizobium sp. PP-WC-1G-195]PYE46625.1 hypothetical protein DFI02_101769 [Rhizobium sp. PP-F2F-G20b]PYE99868.1 hypothetical protein C8J35_102761 [Rhizobium sp. PP-F2F-G38]TCL96206.1 hypothetical protein C8J38_101563 [Rhizobium sp. PP-WC-2G-219]TCP89204.1 hypothetical protein C8J31_102375 [Rhizobium sp. PP-CC-2G-626]TCQ11929.1 h